MACIFQFVLDSLPSAHLLSPTCVASNMGTRPIWDLNGAVNNAAYCGLGTGSVCYTSQFRPNLNRKYTELKNITLLTPIIARRNRLS